MEKHRHLASVVFHETFICPSSRFVLHAISFS